MSAAAAKEDGKWENGRVSGAVYHGGRQHMQLLDQAYSLFSLSNPLHTDIWPSVTQYEAEGELISMTARLLDGGDANVCGSLSSGGTESIILATKSHLQYYRQHGITAPEVVACVSAHAAIEKACALMGIKLIKVPMDPKTYKVSVRAIRRSLSVNTIMIYASAPSFPQGIIDPIAQLSDLALRHGCGLHVDCCLGGFFLPFARRAAAAGAAWAPAIEPFDFGVPGVTSMSCDTHKYGYASKGTSVVLYRSKELRAQQYFCYPDWTGGLYVTPTLAGSRPGGLVAACWASMVSLGEEGYSQGVEAIVEARHKVAKGVADTPDLFVLGDPQAMIVCFGSKTLNIYRVGDAMTAKGWSLNALQNPACLHLCLTLRTANNTQQFLQDLNESAEIARKEQLAAAASGAKDEGTAAMYGMAGSLPSGPLRAIMTTYADVVYKA
ncbi:pyridoxal phosphate-dependent transferase [Tribonema minus]|uniref:sphinganine-1-phosphate aldolase n=1 Tax=Tribonema minus TaxID=303371 RepID=A0A835YUB4_9STRA|nr:pyridoxal phosphate-dependent transferase [Tribonema minus]